MRRLFVFLCLIVSVKFGFAARFCTQIYDENTYKATADRHPDVDLEIILNPENLHANEHGVELLLKQLPNNTKVLIAVGSGTIHDIVRYCDYKKCVDFDHIK